MSFESRAELRRHISNIHVNRLDVPRQSNRGNRGRGRGNYQNIRANSQPGISSELSTYVADSIAFGKTLIMCVHVECITFV